MAIPKFPVQKAWEKWEPFWYFQFRYFMPHRAWLAWDWVSQSANDLIPGDFGPVTDPHWDVIDWLSRRKSCPMQSEVESFSQPSSVFCAIWKEGIFFRCLFSQCYLPVWRNLDPCSCFIPFLDLIPKCTCKNVAGQPFFAVNHKFSFCQCLTHARASPTQAIFQMHSHAQYLHDRVTFMKSKRSFY